MEFYYVADNSSFSKGWAWGWSVRPWERDISILCDVCGKGRLYPGRYPQRSLFVEVENGSEYPDVLGCAASYLVVSEAVTDDWEANQVTGYEKFPLIVAKAVGKAIEKIRPPRYYHIEVTGRCQLDTEAMGIHITYLCPKCGHREHKLLEEDVDENPFDCFPFVIREETWDGSDLFISDLFDRIRFCSQKVVDLAGQYQRTNFRFERPEDTNKYGDGSWAIDYMKAARIKFGLAT